MTDSKEDLMMQSKGYGYPSYPYYLDRYYHNNYDYEYDSYSDKYDDG